VNIPVESPSHFQELLQRRHSSCKNLTTVAARIQDSAGQLNVLAVRANKKAAKKSNATLRCGCQHAKSIHSRMYANQKLGTACNFPGCRCKAYSRARD
jgi:hypothetical protein